jgi:hypothetical protein
VFLVLLCFSDHICCKTRLGQSKRPINPKLCIVRLWVGITVFCDVPFCNAIPFCNVTVT